MLHGGSGGMAASVLIQPLQQFDFKKPDDWAKWKQRFEQFLSASGLDKEDDARKVNMLLYCLGEEAERVLSSTAISDKSRKKYADVIAKFKEHFKVRRNIIYKRARFNKRDRKECESVKEYITALYELAETREYGTLHEEMLCDRLVVGIRDTTLSDKLQIDATLTLEKAKKMVCKKEAVREHRDELTPHKRHLAPEDVTRKTSGTNRHRPQANCVPPRWLPSVSVVAATNMIVLISVQQGM